MEAYQPMPPSTRRVRVVEDRDNLERRRLQKRTGGFYQWVDSAEIFRPDRASTHYIPENERFTKDFSVAEQASRADCIDKQQGKVLKLRKERL